jgi:hypothetical protein
MSNQDIQQEKQQPAAQTQQDKAARIKRNLELMKEAREQEGNSSDYINMKAGDKTVLEFTGDFEPVLREFPEKDKNGNVIMDESGNPKKVQKIRYEYKVIDCNNRGKGVLTWAVSKNTSKSIDEFLEENLTILKVRREGADMGTKYYFVPVTGKSQ